MALSGRGFGVAKMWQPGFTGRRWMHCEPCSHSTASLNQGRSPKPCSGFPAIPDAAPVPSSSAATPATSARHIPDTGHSSQPRPLWVSRAPTSSPLRFHPKGRMRSAWPSTRSVSRWSIECAPPVAPSGCPISVNCFCRRRVCSYFSFAKFCATTCYKMSYISTT